MIPGLGIFRRTITLVLCAGSFWAGTQFVRLGQVDACLGAGGSWNARGYCNGGQP
ncbi:MAG: hypothetical protein V4516_06605 [Pseudomonadota bacterium]